MKNRRILIVEDDSDIREILRYNLAKRGFEITLAEHGEDGIQKALEMLPHLIIADIRMPVMDGIKMVALIKNNALFKRTKILFLTADSDDFTAMKAIKAGGDEFLTKPVSPSIICEFAVEMTDEIFKEPAPNIFQA